MTRAAGGAVRAATPPRVSCLAIALSLFAGLSLASGQAVAQAPAAVPAPEVPAAVPPPGVIGQAPIAAGNTASARERALDEAFRILVEAAFANLLSEVGTTTPSPAQAGVRASWLQRPRRLVRGYKVLEQSEQGGTLSVRVTADLDEAGMRRELERARGVTSPRSVPAGALPVVVLGEDGGGAGRNAANAVATALQTAGHRAEVVSGRYLDEAAVRTLAAKTGRALVVAVVGREQDEGVVRGAGVRSHGCELSARLYPATGDLSAERSAKARAFVADARQAAAGCFGRATAIVLPQLLPDIGGLGVSGELRAVTLDLDLIEPAAMSPLLRSLRKVAGPSSVEVRRIAVGRVEIAVSTRLAGATLLTGLTRELAAAATVTRTGADRGDRVTAQVRLLAPAAAPVPAPAGAQ